MDCKGLSVHYPLLLALCLLTGCAEETAVRPAEAKESTRTSASALSLQTAAMTAALPPTAAPLASFYQALYALQGGYHPGQVNILHLGDSHTAGDKFSGRLRERFQTHFGAAGRGMLPVGEPFPYFRPTHVKVSQSEGWKVFNSHRAPEDGPYGVSGFRLHGSRAGQTIILEKVDDRAFDSLDLEVLNQPGGGTLQLKINDTPARNISTNAAKRRVDLHTLPVPGGGRRIELSLQGDGPVDLLSWSLTQDRPGVIYHSHGIVGTTVNIIEDWNPVLVAGELQHLTPNLIILAYGTNEGYHDDLDLQAYAAKFRAYLSFLRQNAPKAAILIIGPPDANRLPDYCKEREGRGCLPLSQYEENNYQRLTRQKSAQLCRWHAPPMLERVREIQRKITREEGFYFWDWAKLMGKCGAHVWRQRSPALVHKDHVHMTTEGYEISADALFEQLLEHFPGKDDAPRRNQSF